MTLAFLVLCAAGILMNQPLLGYLALLIGAGLEDLKSRMVPHPYRLAAGVLAIMFGRSDLASILAFSIGVVLFLYLVNRDELGGGDLILLTPILMLGPGYLPLLISVLVISVILAKIVKLKHVPLVGATMGAFLGLVLNATITIAIDYITTPVEGVLI